VGFDFSLMVGRASSAADWRSKSSIAGGFPWGSLKAMQRGLICFGVIRERKVRISHSGCLGAEPRCCWNLHLAVGETAVVV
jgi:hypothetical protein